MTSTVCHASPELCMREQHGIHASLDLYMRCRHDSVTMVSMDLSTVVLSSLAKLRLHDVSLTLI